MTAVLVFVRALVSLAWLAQGEGAQSAQDKGRGMRLPSDRLSLCPFFPGWDSRLGFFGAQPPRWTERVCHALEGRINVLLL